MFEDSYELNLFSLNFPKFNLQADWMVRVDGWIEKNPSQNFSISEFIEPVYQTMLMRVLIMHTIQ